MPIIRQGGIAISHTPGARQLVILSHGGWKKQKAIGSRSGDGWISTPGYGQIHFYTVDGQFTIGNRVFQEVMANAAAAYAGTLPAARFPHQQVCTAGQGVKDYALYIDDRPAADSFWRGHTAQTAPNYDADIDLAVIEVEGHKRHLSKVIELAESNGIRYHRIHAGFCRVDR